MHDSFRSEMVNILIFVIGFVAISLATAWGIMYVASRFPKQPVPCVQGDNMVHDHARRD